MSLRVLSDLRKKTGFRLTLAFSTFFVIGTFVLLAFAYLLLAISLQARDRSGIDARLRQLSAQYQAMGLTGLKKSLSLEARIRMSKPYFIRIAGPRNTLLFMEIPDQWADFDLARLPTRALDTPDSFVRLPARDDEAVLEVATRRVSDGFVLQVGKSTEDRDEVLGLFASDLGGVAVVVVLIGTFVGGLQARHVLRPIRELIGTVRAIQGGAMTARVPIRQTGDELDELALLFNDMLRRIATLVEGMRNALDNVAHELRTPVTRMRVAAEIGLQSRQGANVAREALSDCVEESDNLLRLLNGLMEISEAEAGALSLKPEVINILVLMGDVIDLYRHVAEEKGIVLSVSAPEGMSVIADRSRLRQVLANLLDNAIKFTPEGGRVELNARLKQSEAVISVSDTGIGISSDELSSIWGRLYRGKHSGSLRGLGLGLSLVKAIIEAHKGRIEVVSTPGEGSTFTVIMPALSGTDGLPLPAAQARETKD